MTPTPSYGAADTQAPPAGVGSRCEEEIVGEEALAAARMALVAPTAERTAQRCRSAVRLLSGGFLGVFAGFNAAQGLQTSVNGWYGYANLCVLYGVFTLSCNIAPLVLQRLQHLNIPLHVVLVAGAAAYAGTVLANVLENPLVGLAGHALLGAMAPLLWTAQNEYVGRAALRVAEATGEPKDRATAQLNGVFFAAFALSGALGTAISSMVQLLTQGNASLLFYLLAALSAAGGVPLLMLPFMPPVALAEDSEAPQKTTVCEDLSQTVMLTFRDSRLAKLTPLIFANGFLLATMFGDYPRFFVSTSLGPSWAGFVLATFYLTNSLATAVWGSLLGSGRVSILQSLYVATLLQMMFFFILYSGRLDSARFAYDRNTRGWTLNSGQAMPLGWDYAAPFAGSVLFALGDAVYESQVPALLQSCFQGTPHALAAMANYKMFQALGFAAQFFVAVAIGNDVHIRLAMCLGLLAVSLVGLSLLRDSIHHGSSACAVRSATV